MLKWIVERCEGKAGAKDTPIGRMPRYEDLDWEGINVSRETYDKLTTVDPPAWREEIKDHRKLFDELEEPAAGRARREAQGAGAGDQLTARFR